jgi:putative hydrolase of the HAD superfamily
LAANRIAYNQTQRLSNKGNAILPSTTANPIDAVLFDYGLILSGPPDPAAWARMRTIMSLDEEPLHAAYWAFRHDYDRGALTGPAYWRAVGIHAAITLNSNQIAALIAADTDLWTDPNQPMIDWAARLQRAGIRTGILSNIGDSIAEGICAKLPWLSGFYHCTWSHALFLAKPDPAIYLKTAEALHTPPANIFFIDDREDNTEAALSVGMQAIRYTTQAEFEQEMRARGLTALLETGAPTPINP